jgi:Ca2+-binding EF-hand superfamily protein
MINKSLHPDCQLKNIDRMLQLMDFDGSGTIDINEFFEVRSYSQHISFSFFFLIVLLRLIL